LPMLSAPVKEGIPPPMRTIPVAQQAKKTYPLTQLFQFYMDAPQVDKLKIGDSDAARWLSPSAPFSIKDPDDETEYPSVEHFLAGMKYKMSSNKPDLGPGIFSRAGTIHQKFQRFRATESAQGARALTAQRDNELIKEERGEVLDESSGAGFKKYRADFDDKRWFTVKDETLRRALEYRWTHDVRLRKIVEAARNKNLYLLYYTGTGSGSDLGGKRLATGAIDGENKVGTILMQLAGYPV